MPLKKILIVDDDDATLKFIREALELAGDFEVYTAKDGKEGLALTHEARPDLILLDITMPRMDGFTLCEALNKDSLGASIPIIITSALEKEADKIKAFKMGVVDYIVKPIQIEKLKHSIKKALELKETK